MARRKTKTFDLTTLRGRAMRLISASPPKSGVAPRSVPAANYRQELEVHQVELEMQNEELRAARFELEAGLDRYTQLFDFAPIGYATLAENGTIRDINHAGASIFSERRARLVGRRFTFLLKSTDRGSFEEIFRKVQRGDAKETRDLEVLSVGEDRTIIRATATCPPGTRPTVLVAFHDVSSEKRAEENLLRADADLREADRRKDEFLAVLSHELRTPLSALLLYGQLLSQGALRGEKLRRAAEAIERAARAQARLIDDLLDVSRIVAGKLVMQVGEVNVTTVVRAAIDSVSKEAERKHVELLADFAPVPTVTGDADRLQQAVANLLTNAVKFTPTAGQIRIRVRSTGARIRIQVTDSGVGIDPQFLPRIFERFTQGDTTTTRRTGGLGLGLSIVKSIVSAHSGAVEAHSAGRGKGSTFTISLPTGFAPPTAALSGSEPQGLPQLKVPGARLLVVEDDTDTRETLMEVFSIAGAEVRGASGGGTALALFKDFHPDVLVCDIGMPDEDGCSVLRRLRSQSNENFRALALTALGSEEDQRRTLAAGFETHLVKPVPIDRLIAAVSALLEPKESNAKTLN